MPAPPESTGGPYGPRLRDGNADVCIMHSYSLLLICMTVFRVTSASLRRQPKTLIIKINDKQGGISVKGMTQKVMRIPSGIMPGLVTLTAGNTV